MSYRRRQVGASVVAMLSLPSVTLSPRIAGASPAAHRQVGAGFHPDPPAVRSHLRPNRLAMPRLHFRHSSPHVWLNPRLRGGIRADGPLARPPKGNPFPHRATLLHRLRSKRQAHRRHRLRRRASGTSCPTGQGWTCADAGDSPAGRVNS